MHVRCTCYTPAGTHVVAPSHATVEDSQFPGIHFLGSPWKETVTSEGAEFSWEDIGIAFSIPPGAVPEDTPLQLVVRPCLTGPFEPPEGCNFTSPSYIISSTFNFIKGIRVFLYHFISLQTDEDCEHMTFLRAPCTPVYSDSQPKYKFKPLTGGTFQKGKQFGSITLRRFSLPTIGRWSRKYPHVPDKVNQAKKLKCVLSTTLS